MLTILFYINVINGGGAARVMVNLSKQFCEHSYKVLLVTSYRAEGEYELSPQVIRYSLEDAQIEQSRVKKNLSRIRKLRRIIVDEKVDVVVTFMLESNFRGLLATLGLPTCNIVSVRNAPEIEYKGHLNKIVARYLLPQADGCVFQTEEAKSWFPRKLTDKSRVISNPIVSDFFLVKRNPKDKLIVSCGRLTKQKNQEMLINAFAEVNKSISGALLYIFGEGNLQEHLLKRISDLGLEDKVFLKGQTSDVKNVLSEADLFVLSSDYEGMPNALMEAMAVGVPCISTDCPCGGPRMLIKNGENGILVSPGNVDELASSIVKVLSDQHMKIKLGENAKKSVVEYKPERIFGEWEEYVRNICEKSYLK